MTPATRTETDSFGPIEVPADALWGAQTARSLRFFAIGEQAMPVPVVHAIAWVKWAAAGVNHTLGLLDGERARAIADAAQAVAEGRHDREFPLSVWQTGSGTQSHMNVNEVVARLATRSLEAAAGQAVPRVHPNDEVNLGQSSNDVFPTAMHLAVALQSDRLLMPALRALQATLLAKARAFAGCVKIGRTHLQDATPVTLGQEFGAHAAQLQACEVTIRQSLAAVHALAIGGTAVGAGLNTHPAFGARVAAQLAGRFGLPFVQADNLFAALAGHEALVAFHGGLKMLAIALTKIGNDIRLMGSGPRAGLGELRLPANEPGSSIMPGKVNPTQVEALTMVCIQVMANDLAVGLAASQGQFELNVYKPLIAADLLDSLEWLTDAVASFTTHCVAGLQPEREHLREAMARSLMLVTALVPHIGYERAAAIATHAQATGLGLRAAALAVAGLEAAQFDAWVDPARMLGPTVEPGR